MYYTDDNIKKLTRIFDQNSRAEYLRLDLNENPGGLPEEYIQRVLSDIDSRIISEYPETLEFTEILASYLGTDISHLCLTNGSSEGIRYILEAFTSVDGRIVGVSPSYAMFDIYSKMYGRKFIPVTYTDELSMPIDRIIEAITPDTQLLILVNPNNPVGNVYSRDEFETILEEAKRNEVTVLIDEAYHYFYDETFVKYALENDHVFVTRTFSKLFSLAGLRLGYVAGMPEGIALVQKLCTPHNVNAIALLFARHMISDTDIVDKLILNYKNGREWLINELDRRGYEHFGKAGNFLFIRPRRDADEIVKAMKEKHKILIKSYDGIGKLGKCLRITIGEKQYMERFITALEEEDGRDSF